MADSHQREGHRHCGVGYAPAGYPAWQGLNGEFLSDIVLQVLSFVAENERTNIRQRQAEGIAAAKARGCGMSSAVMSTPYSLGRDSPLPQNLTIAAPQTVDALDTEQAVFLVLAVKMEGRILKKW